MRNYDIGHGTSIKNKDKNLLKDFIIKNICMKKNTII